MTWHAAATIVFGKHGQRPGERSSDNEEERLGRMRSLATYGGRGILDLFLNFGTSREPSSESKLIVARQALVWLRCRFSEAVGASNRESSAHLLFSEEAMPGDRLKRLLVARRRSLQSNER